MMIFENSTTPLSIKTGDVNIKGRICYILGGFPEDRCIAPHLSMLEEKSFVVRISAIDSLHNLPNEKKSR